MAGRNEGDFVEMVAALHPLRMICDLLGVPREEEGVVLQIAKTVFGSHDPDHAATLRESVALGARYCGELAATRRARPTEDLASAIANATIDGRPIEPVEAISHLLVLATAGHDTTASAISGGLLALLQNPGELEKLRAKPALVPSAVEEMLRWVTPTTSFCRTATTDTEIRGVIIASGEDVCMSYPSANRDAAVFDAPDEFRIERNPNHHVAFGTGTHACTGQVLARVEMQTLFEELLPRLRHIELNGEPRWVDGCWISALKRLPIRYELGTATK
jgi:hypothetical protein